ncbi:MAG TPA: S24 family peptidase [Stellaceae bacterium]|nr:S24 family peptidase [Stellaceae bacterium]
MSEDQAKRLRRARLEAGYEDATAAARRFGWVIPTYLAHENGSRGFGLARAQLYAQAFKVNWQWLLTGEGSLSSNLRVPVSGYVGAGWLVYPIDEGVGSGGIEEVELPPGVYGDYAAFKVRGDSNYPAYRDNEIIFVRREGGPPQDFLHRECVLDTDDGRRLLKTLTPGSRKGHFTLISFNAPPIVDVRVTWASPVEWTYKR